MICTILTSKFSVNSHTFINGYFQTIVREEGIPPCPPVSHNIAHVGRFTESSGRFYYRNIVGITFYKSQSCHYGVPEVGEAGRGGGLNYL